MKTFFKEPLFHFLLIGVALFIVAGLLDSDSDPVSDREIIISEAKAAQLAALFAKTWRRPPTKSELEGLIDDFVLEEIYYREAVAMGIDGNDTIIRRRLRQKMEFLTDDVATIAEASDEELKAFLEENKDQFRSEPNYTFEQIYFSPDDHGDDPLAFARAKADELRAGGEVKGDSTLLPAALQKAPPRAIDGTFGKGFSQQLDSLEIGQWSDPIISDLGIHLVRIDQKTIGTLPEFEKIRPQVEREWENEKRLEIRQQFNEQLLAKYDITIESRKTGESETEEPK